MKKDVEIRFLNGRQYFISSYTPDAYKKAHHLLAEYKRVESLYNDVQDAFIMSAFEGDHLYRLYQSNRHLLHERMFAIEEELIELDENCRNRKGFSFKKIISPFFEYIHKHNKTLFLIISILYFLSFAEGIMDHAALYRLFFDLFYGFFFAWLSRYTLLKEKKGRATGIL